MSTTSLFVELIVIGVGAAGWLGLTILAVFGYKWVNVDSLGSLPLLVPLLSITYLLGIVVDRAADRMFDRQAQRQLRRSFENRQAYEKARILAAAKSPLLDLMEYNRSRLRICRGWIVNCAALGISLNAFVWSQLPEELPRARISVASTLIVLGLGLGALHAWYRLCSNAYESLAMQAEMLTNSSGKGIS
ncbi:MAG: hypothetical protein ACRDK3_07895 [Actinomycetota bacterium]